MYWLKACKRCGGDLYVDNDRHGPFVSCIQCGAEPSEYNRPAGAEGALFGQNAPGAEPGSS